MVSRMLSICISISCRNLSTSATWLLCDARVCLLLRPDFLSLNTPSCTCRYVLAGGCGLVSGGRGLCAAWRLFSTRKASKVALSSSGMKETISGGWGMESIVNQTQARMCIHTNTHTHAHIHIRTCSLKHTDTNTYVYIHTGVYNAMFP